MHDTTGNSSSAAETKLVEDYDIELISPPCHPGADVWTVKCNLDTDIGEVLPYLNAALDGANYDHKAKVLVWKTGKKKYAFRPADIRVGPIQERSEASALCDQALEIVNDVWSRKENIEPDYEKKYVPSVMEIYKLLPRNNCKGCGYSTCMAFAAALRDNKEELCQCPELAKEEYRDSLKKLEQLEGIS